MRSRRTVRGGYKQAIDEDVKSDKIRLLKWENVLACIDLLTYYEQEKGENHETNSISLADFLTHTQLDQSKIDQREKRQNDNRVNVMTFHSSKGLEFKACFLACLEDHLIPHEKSLTESGIEEERRLFYVAMTRAQERLTLSMARTRTKIGKAVKCNPSRFIFEIPRELLRVSSWKAVP